jgi:hypothetical protein
MSKVSITGNASGTGTFTIAAPNSNTDRTLTLPDEAGTVLTSGGAIDVDASAPADSVVIDASGNVGIGTTNVLQNFGSGRTSLAIKGDGSTNYATLQLGSGGTAANDQAHGFVNFYDGTTSVSRVASYRSSNTSDAYLSFFTAPSSGGITERMRIASGGVVLLGATSHTGWAPSTEGIAVKTTNGNHQCFSAWNSAISGTRYLAYFGVNSSFTSVGSITSNGSSTSYNTTSDYRLKEDWQPMSGSIDRLKNLNPVNFAWKVDGSRVDGFLAHEAAEVVPEAVTGEKDAVEAIGNVTDAEGTVVQENVKEPAELAEGQTWTKTEDRPMYQGIDQAKLVPLLTAALQEAISKIETLEAKVAALEAAP